MPAYAAIMRAETRAVLLQHIRDGGVLTVSLALALPEIQALDSSPGRKVLQEELQELTHLGEINMGRNGKAKYYWRFEPKSLRVAERRLAEQVAATFKLREEVFELECQVAALREERQLPMTDHNNIASNVEHLQSQIAAHKFHGMARVESVREWKVQAERARARNNEQIDELLTLIARKSFGSQPTSDAALQQRKDDVRRFYLGE